MWKRKQSKLKAKDTERTSLTLPDHVINHLKLIKQLSAYVSIDLCMSRAIMSLLTYPVFKWSGVGWIMSLRSKKWMVTCCYELITTVGRSLRAYVFVQRCVSRPLDVDSVMRWNLMSPRTLWYKVWHWWRWWLEEYCIDQQQVNLTLRHHICHSCTFGVGYMTRQLTLRHAGYCVYRFLSPYHLWHFFC